VTFGGTVIDHIQVDRTNRAHLHPGAMATNDRVILQDIGSVHQSDTSIYSWTIRYRRFWSKEIDHRLYHCTCSLVL